MTGASMNGTDHLSDKVQAKLRKLQALAERGEGGEKANAQHMLECEARYWLRRGYTTPDKILELGQLLKKRSNVALGRLIDEMREQWRRRREWE